MAEKTGKILVGILQNFLTGLWTRLYIALNPFFPSPAPTDARHRGPDDADQFFAEEAA
jgi:hypothetical protein